MDYRRLLAGMDPGYALFGTFFAFGNRLQAACDTFYGGEITCKQFFLLICLGLFHGEAPTVNELAEVMGSSHQNVKQIANKLEKAGFVTITRDEQDKRKLRITETDKVEQFGARFADKQEQFMDDFYHGVSREEIERTFQILLQLESNLKGAVQEEGE